MNITYGVGVRYKTIFGNSSSSEGPRILSIIEFQGDIGHTRYRRDIYKNKEASSLFKGPNDEKKKLNDATVL